MKEKLSNLLEEGELKITKQRLAVLKQLHDAHVPLSIKEIYARLKKTNIDHATIYRVCLQLRQKNIIRQTDFRQGLAFFEINDIEHEHHHVMCEKCRKINDIVIPQCKRLEKNALKQAKAFSEIYDHNIEFFGICKTCAKKQA
jgi:Fe2+ or Zn2+ uptake regulation protein